MYRHLTVMPDVHQGYGCPIGTVFASKGVVVPNLVGVDIGCGMLAVRSNIPADLPELAWVLPKVVDLVKKRVPVGFFWNDKPCDPALMPNVSSVPPDSVVLHNIDDARLQLGTLGGGNHFIEVQAGSDGMLWFMIHSGSRNLGKKVAEEYNNIAVELNARWHSAVPKAWQLAFLPLDTQEGRDYMAEMRYCVEFALANRMLMAQRITNAFYDAMPGTVSLEFSEPINIAHNFAALEHHFGENVVVHRKGATPAHVGLTGIIPGSMGTASYIVEGLGNRESFMSCSHGAGRQMGRGEAKRRLDLEQQAKMLDDQGIIHGMTSVDNLDEAPGAYKDIDQVMADQTDLVRIVTKLRPLAVVKG